MKKKLLWILGICLLLAATVIPAKPTYAEDEKTYISGGGVNRAIFGDGSITDAQSGEETDSLFIGAAPEQRVDGYLTYSEAVSYMRSQMVSRRTGFLLKVAMAADLKQDGVYEAFLKDVCAETDSPVEGDYLLMHFRNYGYSGTRENKTVSGMYLYTLNITFKYLSTAMEERMLNLEIDNILKQLNLEQDNEYQKVQKIYDYIASNITYDNEAFEMLKKWKHWRITRRAMTIPIIIRILIRIRIGGPGLRMVLSSRKHVYVRDMQTCFTGLRERQDLAFAPYAVPHLEEVMPGILSVSANIITMLM